MTTTAIPSLARPTSVMDPMITHMTRAMRDSGRIELIGYAGACWRDDVAWQVVLAWDAQPHLDRCVLLARAYHVVYGWRLTPEECSW